MSSRRQTPESKIDAFVEKVAQNKSGVDAVIESGWDQTRKAARVTASRLLSNPIIAERVERRKHQAREAAKIETEVILGQLNEIATSSIADVLSDDDEFLRKAKENGTDHLIKKIKVNRDKEGAVSSVEYEMYDRLKAIDQIRDSVGLKVDSERHPADVERDQKQIDFVETYHKLVASRADQSKHLTINQIILQVRAELTSKGLGSLLRLLPDVTEPE